MKDRSRQSEQFVQRTQGKNILNVFEGLKEGHRGWSVVNDANCISFLGLL